MSGPAKSSPVPWRTEYGFVGSARRLFVIVPGMDGLLPASDADAELIVRAVNSHAKLVAALESLVDQNLSYFNGFVVTGLIAKRHVAEARKVLAEAKGA